MAKANQKQTPVPQEAEQVVNNAAQESSEAPVPQEADPVEQEQEQEPEQDAPKAGPAPTKVTLLKPYGFIDDEGQNRHWHQGAEVTDEKDIAVLIERGAAIEEVSE
jgi:hypothetical protein